MSESRLFTAARIGAVVGKSARNVRLIMRREGIAGHPMMVREQRALGWTISELPATLASTLLRVAQREKYHSIEHLLSVRPESWKPAIPVDDLAQSEVERAEKLCAVLAPILAKPNAEELPIAALVNRAIADFAALSTPLHPCERAIRQWIELACARDRGEGQWQRWELYLSETPRRKTVQRGLDPSQAEIAGPVLVTALACVSNREKPTAQERKRIFDAAFQQLSSQEQAGANAARVKRQLIRLLDASGVKLAASRAALGMAWLHLHRKWMEGGQDTSALADGRKGRSGRPTDYQLSRTEKCALRSLVLQRESFALAIEQFAYDPKCRPMTRALILEELDDAARRQCSPSWPLSLRRAGYVTAEERAKFRGQKSFQVVEHCDRRGLWWFDECGTRHSLLPNTLWESDDMSSNEPFSWPDPETGEIRIGRQTLCTQDVFSASWLGATPLGRERDAYRAEDIADHLLDTVRALGLPQFWRFERGTWECAMIGGIKLRDGKVWGSLDELFGVIRTWKSRGKGGIEVGFDLVQSLQAHRSDSIGRTRGEFEAETRRFLRACRGDAKAAANFWPIGEYADALKGAMEAFNGRPKRRRAFGRKLVVPADLYAGAVRRECPENQLWRFSPVKKTATVRKGHIEVNVPHYPLPFRFRVNGEVPMLYLENGYGVLIAFHPGHLERGCYVFNGETSARNRDGWPLGEPLLLAPCAEDAPQFALSRDEQAFLARRQANAAVTSEFRAVAGRSRVSVSRDGFGRSVRVETGPNEPLSSPAADALAQRSAARVARQKQGKRLQEEARALRTEKHAEPPIPSIELIRAKVERLTSEGKLSPFR